MSRLWKLCDTWHPTAFGAMDPQGADFRACQNFGPL
jgi:hypothetical protein